MIKNLLIIGKCGVGKTWVMKNLIVRNPGKYFKLGKFIFIESDKLIIIGKYDGSIYEGSDKLSMSLITDLDIMLKYIKKQNKIAIFEGDRFTNYKFINKADPYIVRILGSGVEGRKKRNSRQTSRHIKYVSTKVNNIKSHKDCSDSSECLSIILDLISEK